MAKVGDTMSVSGAAPFTELEFRNSLTALRDAAGRLIEQIDGVTEVLTRASKRPNLQLVGSKAGDGRDPHPRHSEG